jgi:hypothetical protein
MDKGKSVITNINCFLFVRLDKHIKIKNNIRKTSIWLGAKSRDKDELKNLNIASIGLVISG